MGIFYVDCEVMNTRQPARKVSVSKLLVGSDFTWIPAKALKQIGVQVDKKDVPILMANGQTIFRSIGYAILETAGFKTVDEVVFAQSQDLSLLGSRTLEGFGARVDPRRKRLVSAGPHVAAAGNVP